MSDPAPFDSYLDQFLDYLTVEKGSVAVNGVSLTVVNSQTRSFQVAIIPFTYEVTNFHQIKKGTEINAPEKSIRTNFQAGTRQIPEVTHMTARLPARLAWKVMMSQAVLGGVTVTVAV